MDYNFLDSSVDKDDIVLPESDKINPFLLKNNYADIIKAVDFFSEDAQFMYIHGFLGTGKRQFINYITDFLNKDVIKLEYYCKASTVCDDILLSFIDIIEKNSISKAVNLNAKVTTLAVKFQQYLTSIKKPFIIILHSYDDILDENKQFVIDFLQASVENSNVKIIISTRAMLQDITGVLKVDRKIFLKAFSKEIFKNFLEFYKIECTETTLADFYKYTRGYYYYTALSVKIIQAMKISLNDFLANFTASKMSFDAYLGTVYVNLIPATIRNFFWFLRTVRHGMSLNALAVFELYDEFSIEYLKTNLMVFQVGETVYVQDYFQQDIDISVPAKTEIKLHKYIINIYEKQLKEPLKTREIKISRQALRAEIEYHSECIKNIEQGGRQNTVQPVVQSVKQQSEFKTAKHSADDIKDMFENIKKLTDEKKYTDAIEICHSILDNDKTDISTLQEIRLVVARLYKEIHDYQKAEHYYELVEAYYKKNNEVINLSYLYYELTELYYLMYKNERAVETIKKVIYSVDTPQSLMVSACTLLGKIYFDMNNTKDAYSYYQKALASLDDNTPDKVLAELYFKFALVNDENNDEEKAFEYYTKCIVIKGDNPYRPLAYSNMGSCYFDNENYSDAKACFLKAYEIEKSNNNYDGIYYTSSYLAKICLIERNFKKALEFLLEAKQCAEFINEDFYILEATVALGDYYYNNVSLNKKALIEYLKARRIAQTIGEAVDINKINARIRDMELRMDKEVFKDLESKYG